MELLLKKDASLAFPPAYICKVKNIFTNEHKRVFMAHLLGTNSEKNLNEWEAN